MVMDARYLVQFIDERFPATIAQEVSDVKLARSLGAHRGRILRRYADQVADDLHKPITMLINVAN